ncbi:MAG: hypothetical protein JSS63_09290 [Bacteroidetes bacterium]|nr:hypothetical protein [Bacteroidota bacterium]
MKTVEFKARVRDGVIKIPKSANFSSDKEAKVTIEWDDSNGRNYDAKKIKEAIKAAKEMNLFGDIDDPVKWQRKQRDEWD